MADGINMATGNLEVNSGPSQENDMSYLRALVGKHGLGKELFQEMKNKKDEWRKEKISVAVVGQARHGKSSHINAHIGQRVAKVGARGVVTTEPKSYVHPVNNNIIMWDLPGVDANRFSRENYEMEIRMNENDYDFYLLLSDSVFCGDDKWLADLILDHKKRYYLVRTKVDRSVEDEMEDNPDLGSEKEDIIADIRQRLEKQLDDLGFHPSIFKVYLVNNKKPNDEDLDFMRLQEDICNQCESELKQEALMITIGGHNQSLINAKYEMFRTRIVKASFASAAGALVPIPGFGAGVDLTIIVEEVLTYFLGFGLYPDAIQALEELNEVEQGSIEAALLRELYANHSILYVIRQNSPRNLASPGAIKDAALLVVRNASAIIMSALAMSTTSELVETGAEYLLPVVGFAIAAGVSFFVTRYQLNSLLDQVKKVADFVNSVTTNQEFRRAGHYAIE